MSNCQLAMLWCDVALPEAVCMSGAGYYIGCVDPQTGEPISRESVEYFATEEQAQRALDGGDWTQRQRP